MILVCSGCNKIFEKVYGVPCLPLNDWVCSDTCKNKLLVVQTDEFIRQKSFKKNDIRQDELSHQQKIRNEKEMIDLEFKYRYNDI